MEIATATGRLKAIRRTKFYDLLAAVPLIAWYLFCAAHMLPLLADQVALIKLFVRTDPSVLPSTLVLDALSHVCTLIFLVALVVMFAVRHTPQHTALGLYPRLAAVAGTFLSVGFVLLPSQELSSGLYLASLLLLIAGTGFAICSVLVLGRSISILPAARRLVTRGPYALVRHPLYLGEMVALAGVAIQYLSGWSLFLLALVCAIQLKRMRYEELVLVQLFPEYRDYMARTARLVPGVY
jgi:protein-S-isoprenylcysteine O-methyltransferase Ste14